MQRSTMPWTNAVPLLRDTFVIHIIPGSHNGCGIFVPSLNASINSNKETQPLPMYQNSPVPALDIKRNADDVAVVPRVHICNGPQVLVLPVSSCMSSSARKRRISPPSSTSTVCRPVLGRTQRTYSSLPISYNPHLPLYEHTHVSTATIMDHFRDIVSPDTIRDSMSHFQSKKTPGPDRFKPVLLLFPYSERRTCPVCVIYHSCLSLNYMPHPWKECTLIFIPKTGKDTYSHPSYHPISLSNYLLKMLEHLCPWHVDQCVRLRPRVHSIPSPTPYPT